MAGDERDEDAIEALVGLAEQRRRLARFERPATRDLRDLPVSYMISTGNEAGVGLPDFVDFFTSDPNTQMIVVYVEEVRDPQGFKAAAHRAREAGKPVIMMHPGRTSAAAT